VAKFFNLRHRYFTAPMVFNNLRLKKIGDKSPIKGSE